jgi:hypothetical protein
MKGILKIRKIKIFEKGSPASIKLSIFSKESTDRYMLMTTASTKNRHLKISPVKYLWIIDINSNISF